MLSKLQQNAAICVCLQQMWAACSMVWAAVFHLQTKLIVNSNFSFWNLNFVTCHPQTMKYWSWNSIFFFLLHNWAVSCETHQQEMINISSSLWQLTTSDKANVGLKNLKYFLSNDEQLKQFNLNFENDLWMTDYLWWTAFLNLGILDSKD